MQAVTTAVTTVTSAKPAADSTAAAERAGVCDVRLELGANRADGTVELCTGGGAVLGQM